MRDVVVAKIGNGGQFYTGKREVEFYEADSEVTAQMLADANTGLRLREQADIRRKLAIKHGFKKVTSAGESVSLDDIDNI